jgi:hypothetical protein
MIRHFLFEATMWAASFIGVGGLGVAVFAQYIGII